MIGSRRLRRATMMQVRQLSMATREHAGVRSSVSPGIHVSRTFQPVCAMVPIKQTRGIGNEVFSDNAAAWGLPRTSTSSVRLVLKGIDPEGPTQQTKLSSPCFVLFQAPRRENLVRTTRMQTEDVMVRKSGPRSPAGPR